MNDHVNPIIAQALETVVPPDNRTIADRIASLRETARREWAASLEATARSYDAESEAYRLEGDAIRCEFYVSIAAAYRNEPGANERRERAYAALVAAREAEDEAREDEAERDADWRMDDERLGA